MQMANKKMPVDQIFESTGWFKGLEGKWRYEIPDSKAKFTQSFASKGEQLIDENADILTLPLNKVIDHPSLFSAYPELKNVDVQVDNSLKSLGAYLHNPSTGKSTIALNMNKIIGSVDSGGSHPLEILLHEIQHAVQKQEGFDILVGYIAQLKEQKEMSNLLMKQIEIILSRTSHANTILDNTNNLINTLNQTMLNKNISHLHDVLVDQHHVSSKSNIMQSQIQTNNDYLSQSQKEDNDNNRHNSTVEYILKKIENNSLSTREIQKIIGRSREHTSRLMKKLYDNRFVERNINSKPFKYTITDEGRKLLIKHSASKNYHHVDVQKNIENLSDEMSAMTK
jgi:predicted transcriptional regulator